MHGISKLILHVVLLIGAAIFIIPLLWMLSTALKPIDQAMSSPPRWVPYAWTMEVDGKPLEVGFTEMPEKATPDTPVTVDVAYQWQIEVDGQRVPVRYNPSEHEAGGPVNVVVDYHLQAQVDGDWLPAKADDPLGALVSTEPVSVAVVDKDGYTFRRSIEPGALRKSFDLTKRDLRISFGESQTLSVPAESLIKTPINWGDRQELAHIESEQRLVEAGALNKEVEARWDNFPKAIEAMDRFPNYLWNTLTLCVLTVIGTVASSTLVAYGFSRIDWPGRDKLFLVVLATMMIPFPVVMVPLFTMFKNFGWIGSLKPLWVPTFFAGAFNVFLLRQFFRTIPKDLSESARIDGCSEFRIFWQIILPLAKPAITVVALFQFMGTWNDFLGPLIYLTDQKDFTLALGLQFFQSQHGGTQWHYLMAASALVVLPIIVLFFFAQRTFIEGISMTGLKA